MDHSHREIREVVCYGVFGFLTPRPIDWTIPLMKNIVISYRSYKRTRPLVADGRTDRDGRPVPRKEAVREIGSAVNMANFEALRSAFAEKKRREEKYERWAKIVAEDDRYGYLRWLVNGADSRDCDAILVIGVAGVDFKRAPLLVRHQLVDYRAIGTEIAKMWRNANRRDYGKADS
ncbi:hypothetical protein Aca07nite_41540 [Actinoplanes capillaceus]|uniref:Uncharacterized protein n=2 Tax=Actinoplanes campanulatus TaxID=113559 RepID=A0ABQ3WKW3_9ACTN|nr:hypothetical protein Aca07nite_41540 [Actinoplanes capillaceus]